MPDYVWNIVICLAIFWVGYKIGKVVTVVRIAKEVADQIGDLDQTGQKDQLISIEKHDQHYYAFNQENKFLAQGSSFLELMTNIKTRFPGQDFRIVEQQDSLTAEESGHMIKAIFEVFGDPETKKETA